MTAHQALVDYFARGCKGTDRCELLGVEVEHFVTAGDGTPIGYDPVRDLPTARDLLYFLSRWYGEEHYSARGDLLELIGDDGSISLEPAAQLEISLAPQSDVREIAASYQRFREHMESFAKPFGAHLVNEGYHPNRRARELSLIPKERYRIMDRYFARIGSHGMRMMRATASAQVSIDYASEADAVRKMRVATALSPILSAIADNTRTFEGRQNHVPLRRLQLWREVDDTRCGTINGLFDEGFGFDSYADWMLEASPIFVCNPHDDASSGDELLEVFSVPAKKVFDEYNPLTQPHIEQLVSVFWPDVRLKQLVEIRAADCVPADCIAGYAALIKGLFYSEASLASIEEALGVEGGMWPLSSAAVGGVISAIQADGFDAEVYGKSLRWWENLLFSLAREALGDGERPYLEPLARFAANKTWWYTGDAKVIPTGLRSQRFDQLVASIREGYVAEDAFFMEHKRVFPRRAQVYELIDMIRSLLFPGYFDDETPAGSSSDTLVRERVMRVSRMLAEQVRRALMYEDCMLDEQEATDRAQQIAEGFMDRLPHIQSLILKDAEAAFEGDPAARSREEVILTYPGMYAILVHRIAHELFIRGVALIPRLMSEEAHSKTGIDIAPGATIGEYFFIDHGTGVVIGETTVIGHHAKIYQGVTLGATSTRKGQQLAGVKRHPTLGNYVTVYSNASVLGGDTYIGSGSVIGGSAFVCESVPDNARVGVKDQEIVVRRMGEPEPVWCYSI